jgi:hypothetical protein
MTSKSFRKDSMSTKNSSLRFLEHNFVFMLIPIIHERIYLNIKNIFLVIFSINSLFIDLFLVAEKFDVYGPMDGQPSRN